MKLSEMVNIYSVEGEDHTHLNPFSKSVTGRYLSPEWRQKFFIPKVGSFVSPVSFCNWVSGAGEGARFNDRVKGKIKIPYKKMMTLAKYHQLRGMAVDLENLPEDWDTIPMTRYRVHVNGVKELLPDDQWYPWAVRTLTAWVRTKTEPDWDIFEDGFAPYALLDDLVRVNIMGQVL